MLRDPDALATAVATAIKLALAPHLARIAVLEAKCDQLRDGRDGLPGIPGPAGPPGTNGCDGAPGRDGTLDQLVPIYDGHRTLTLCRKDTGEAIDGWALRLPLVLDEGVWKAGQTYEAGAGVSWSGSFWIAQQATSSKPGDADSGWRLAVKRGGDGKPGPKGDRGLTGDSGRDGRIYT